MIFKHVSLVNKLDQEHTFTRSDLIQFALPALAKTFAGLMQFFECYGIIVGWNASKVKHVAICRSLVRSLAHSLTPLTRSHHSLRSRARSLVHSLARLLAHSLTH